MDDTFTQQLTIFQRCGSNKNKAKLEIRGGLPSGRNTESSPGVVTNKTE
jgi:hypothetical protein